MEHLGALLVSTSKPIVVNHLAEVLRLALGLLLNSGDKHLGLCKLLQPLAARLEFKILAAIEDSSRVLKYQLRRVNLTVC